MTMTVWLMLLAGFALLMVGGEVLVKGSVDAAKKLGVSPLVIGLTLVGFGTSAPELVTSVKATWAGSPGIAVGNFVGSNIANVLLVLGLPAIIAPIASTSTGIRRNALIALAFTGLFIALCWDGGLGLMDGVILSVGIIGYIGFLALTAKTHRDDPMIAELTDIDQMEGLPSKAPMVALFLLGGLVMLPVGAKLIVDGGVGIAELFNVSDAVIGLTILAFGTSLPELATAFVAAMRKQGGMAIGNVVGSNIFNICAVGGITGVAASVATGAPAPVEAEFLQFDFWIMAAAALAVLAYAVLRRPIGRMSGVAMSLAYVGYIAILLLLNPPRLPL
jgi:cation:H+ antiporter